MTTKVLAYTNVETVQDNYYWCGPASTHMVLSTGGVNMSQAQCANELGTTVEGTADIANVVRVLRDHLPDSNYEAVYPVYGDAESLWRNIIASIEAGRGLVFNIDVPPSNYPKGVHGSPDPAYGGGEVFHYIAGMGYDDGPPRAVYIADPGFRPFSYWVALDQLVTMIPPKGYAWANTVAQQDDSVEAVMATNQEKFDRMLFELTNEWPDWSMYRTTNDPVPGNTLVGAVLRAKAFAWDNRVEACAERGEQWAIDLVKACATGTGIGVIGADGKPDQFLVNHAKAVLAKVPKA